MRRCSVLLTCSVVALGAVLPVDVNLAGAQGMIPRTCTLFSASSGKALDIAGASTADGAPLIQWPANGGANQVFSFEPIDYSLTVIRNINSGKVLDVAGESKADGAPVIQWTYHGGLNQQWQVANYQKVMVLINKNSGKVLDVPGASTADGTQLIQWTPNAGVNQFFLDNANCTQELVTPS